MMMRKYTSISTSPIPLYQKGKRRNLQKVQSLVMVMGKMCALYMDIFVLLFEGCAVDSRNFDIHMISEKHQYIQTISIYN